MTPRRQADDRILEGADRCILSLFDLWRPGVTALIGTPCADMQDLWSVSDPDGLVPAS